MRERGGAGEGKEGGRGCSGSRILVYCIVSDRISYLEPNQHP